MQLLNTWGLAGCNCNKHACQSSLIVTDVPGGWVQLHQTFILVQSKVYAFMFLFCLVFAMSVRVCLYVLRGHLLGRLSFVVSSVSLSLSHWYPGSGVVLDCIDS